MFPADPLSNTAFDNHVVVLIGNSLAEAVPVVLPEDTFARTNDIYCTNVATITGAAGHAAAPPVYLSGPHNNATATATQIQVQRTFVFPTAMVNTALTTVADGCYTLPLFHATFLQAELAAGGARADAVEEMRDFF